MNAWDYYFKFQNQKHEFDLFYVSFKLKNINNKDEYVSLINMLKKISTMHQAPLTSYLALKFLMKQNLSSFNLKDVYFKNHMEKNQFICGNSYKEKYILIGASWCAPCRKAFYELLEFENKNKDKLEIIYLLIDENRNYIEKVLFELKQRKSKIILLIDNKNFNNEILKKFNIDAIPKLFVLNNNCEIIQIK